MNKDKTLECPSYLHGMELEQPAQEPVAWMFIDDGNKYLSFYRCLDKGKKIPLYAKESIDD